MALSPVWVFILSVLINTMHGGPLHPLHPPRSQITSEKYEITAVMHSGKANPQWNITESDIARSKNISTIVKVIDWYAHEIMGHGKGTAPKLANKLGYTGFKINHFINGASIHEWDLPTCQLPKLEEALVNYTAPDLMKNATQGIVLNAVETCKKTQKQKTA